MRTIGYKVGILGIFVVGCGDFTPEVEKGQPATVLETEFIPEHTILVNGMCAIRSQDVCIMYYKNKKVVEDSYRVTLEQCKPPESTEEPPVCGSATIAVDPASFDLASNNPVVFYTESGSFEYYAE